jgi:hypothetical protein
MGTVNQPYTENFDTLIAVVTHLSNTDFESRTVTPMAKDLGLDPNKVRYVVENFPAYFRKSKMADSKGEHFYTVHLRYARRKKDGERVDTEPLKPEEFSSLLDLISKMVANESETSRLHLDLEHRNKTLLWTNVITMVAALVAAGAAIVAAS